MIFGRENHFCGIREWRLLGIAWGFSLFALSTAAWQFAREKMIFGSRKSFFSNWTVVIAGFLSFFVSTAAWQAAPEKMTFGSGKSFFWNWTVVIAGFLSFLCLQLLGRLPRKTMIFGSGKTFFWNWTVVIAGFFFFVSTAAWQAARKKHDFWVGKIIFWSCGEW